MNKFWTYIFTTAIAWNAQPVSADYLQGGVGVDMNTSECQTISRQQQATVMMQNLQQSFAASDDSNRSPIGLINGLAKVALPHRHRLLRGDTSGNLSALGVEWNGLDGQVLLIDPASDLYGKLFLGDIVLSIDNENCQQYWMSRHNYGAAGTMALFHIQHRNGSDEFLMCRRKPVQMFSPEYRSSMLTP